MCPPFHSDFVEIIGVYFVSDISDSEGPLHLKFLQSHLGNKRKVEGRCCQRGTTVVVKNTGPASHRNSTS